MRHQAVLDARVLAYDPLEDREADREHEVDREDRADDAEDDLFQEPHGAILVNGFRRGTKI
jgi:hypothetical protein